MVTLSVTLVFATEVAVTVAVVVCAMATGAMYVADVLDCALKVPTLVPRVQVTPAFVASFATLAAMAIEAPWLSVTEHEVLLLLVHAAEPAGVNVMVMADFPEQPGKVTVKTRIAKANNPRNVNVDTAILLGSRSKILQ